MRNVNPVEEWPASNDEKSCQTVTFGAHYLGKDSCNALASYEIDDFKDHENGAAIKVLNKLNSAKHVRFRQFEQRGEYFYSTTSQTDALGTEHIGSYRLKFYFAPCGHANVMAQLFEDKEKKYSFRHWNPDNLNA